jgi:hypothetical protein
VNKDRKDPPALQVQLVPQGHKDLRDLQVLRDQQVNKAHKDRLV